MRGHPDEVWGSIAASPFPYIWIRLLRDRWVRFHSLPDAKRYADSSEEYEELLLRANTIIGEVCGLNNDLMMVAGVGGRPGVKPKRYPALIEIQPAPSYWREVRDPFDSDPDGIRHLWVSWVTLEPGVLDRAIRLCADQEVYHLMLVSPERGAVVSPYDGGLDALMPTPQERDELHLKFVDWTSPRPDGL